MSISLLHEEVDISIMAQALKASVEQIKEWVEQTNLITAPSLSYNTYQQIRYTGWCVCDGMMEIAMVKSLEVEK